MRKVSPIVGWLIGLGVGSAVFMTVGVWVLFLVSYGVMHGTDGGVGTLIYFFGSWIAVIAGCLWLAHRVKRAVTRQS